MTISEIRDLGRRTREIPTHNSGLIDFEKADSKITMTIEDLEKANMDPEYVFTQYCKDIAMAEPTEHMMELFNEAMSEYEREVTEK